MALAHAAFLPAAVAAAGKTHLWSSDKEILVSHVIGRAYYTYFKQQMKTNYDNTLLEKTHDKLLK